VPQTATLIEGPNRMVLFFWSNGLVTAYNLQEDANWLNEPELTEDVQIKMADFIECKTTFFLHTPLGIGLILTVLCTALALLYYFFFKQKKKSDKSKISELSKKIKKEKKQDGKKKDKGNKAKSKGNYRHN